MELERFKNNTWQRRQYGANVKRLFEERPKKRKSISSQLLYMRLQKWKKNTVLVRDKSEVKIKWQKLKHARRDRYLEHDEYVHNSTEWDR